MRGPTEPLNICVVGASPVGTSGPTAWVGSGTGVDETGLADDGGVIADGAAGETEVRPPHAATKNRENPTTANLGPITVETSAIPDAPLGRVVKWRFPKEIARPVARASTDGKSATF